jgi:5-methylcytosine-specific restriction endonuclease McrA
MVLLGKASINTAVSEDRKAYFDKKWKPFEPVIDEESPSFLKTGDKLLSISNFCPEVAFETFGYFASGLYGYGDEIDRGVDQKAYEREGISERFDPAWASVIPRHYTECREYSIHTNFAVGKLTRGASVRKGLSPQIRWKVLARDSFTCAYCGSRPPDVALEVDPKVSVKDGGSNDLENLVTACSGCNGGKGAVSLRTKIFL